MKEIRGIYIVKSGVKFHHPLIHNYFTPETMRLYDSQNNTEELYRFTGKFTYK